MKSTGSHIFKPMLSGVVLVGLAIFAATPATAQGMLSCTPTKMKQVRGMIDYAKEIKAQPQLIQSAERRYGFARKYQNEPRAIGNPCEKTCSPHTSRSTARLPRLPATASTLILGCVATRRVSVSF